MAYSIVLDLLLAILLAVTIGYAMVLNRKISGLRRDRASLEKLLASFNKTTDKAAESLADLQGTARGLQAKIDTATTLRDDLAFLVDRGITVADRLEDGVRDARRDGPAPAPSVADAPKPGPRPVQASRPAGLRADAPDRIMARGTPEGLSRPPARGHVEPRGAVETFPGLKTVDDDNGPMEMEPRSEAERDLLKALRAARQA